MESVTEFISQSREFFMSIVNPYKHTTIGSVYQDVDIENQYEKAYVAGIVGSGNIFVNLLVHKLQLLKYIGRNTIDYINEMMKPKEEVTIIENEDGSSTDSSNDYEVVTDKKHD